MLVRPEVLSITLVVMLLCFLSSATYICLFIFALENIAGYDLFEAFGVVHTSGQLVFGTTETFLLFPLVFLT